jgi:DNA polymerase-3 subunit delta'
MSLQDVRDQDVAVRFLSRILEEDRIPNAMLFWGPAGVGKSFSALEFVKSLMGRDCDPALTAQKIDHGNHPDLRIVAPLEKSRMIKLQQIEEVAEIAYLRPYEAQWRVVIVQDADRMNVTAQNHFLKTLEEPPGKTLFILLSAFPRLMLPTIRSRCLSVRFRRLMPQTVVEFLQRDRDLPTDIAEAVAALAQGQMSRAFDLVDTEKREIALAVTSRLAEGEDPVSLAEEFTKSLNDQRKQIEAAVAAEFDAGVPDDAGREDIEQLKEQQLALVQALFKRDVLDYLYLLETWYRDEMVYAATGQAECVLNRDQVDRLESRSSKDPGKKIAALEKAREYLDRFINEERVFRDLFFTLAAP